MKEQKVWHISGLPCNHSRAGLPRLLAQPLIVSSPPRPLFLGTNSDGAAIGQRIGWVHDPRIAGRQSGENFDCASIILTDRDRRKHYVAVADNSRAHALRAKEQCIR